MALIKLYDNRTYIQALTMLQMETPVSKIVESTCYDKSTISQINKRARERGYDLSKNTKIYLCYVKDTLRVGRPKKYIPEVEKAVFRLFPRIQLQDSSQLKQLLLLFLLLLKEVSLLVLFTIYYTAKAISHTSQQGNLV